MLIVVTDCAYKVPVIALHSGNDDVFDALIAGALNNRIPVTVESVKIKVAMAIDNVIHATILPVFSPEISM